MSAFKRRRKERIQQIFRGNAEASWREWKHPPTGRQRFNKWAICVLLYALAVAAFRWEHPVAEKAEGLLRSAMTESFDFHKAADWYKRHIGTVPSFLPAFETKGRSEGKAAPVAGRLGGYTDAGEGIWLTVEPGAKVQAIEEGWVIFAGELPSTGLTVVLRHANGLESVYGRLDSVLVGKNDWLKGGAMIGTAEAGPAGQSGVLYFAVRKQGRHVHPGEVIPLD